MTDNQLLVSVHDALSNLQAAAANINTAATDLLKRSRRLLLQRNDQAEGTAKLLQLIDTRLSIERYSFRAIYQSLLALSDAASNPSDLNKLSAPADSFLSPQDDPFRIAAQPPYLLLQIPRVLRFSKQPSDSFYPAKQILKQFLQTNQETAFSVFQPAEALPLTVYFLHIYQVGGCSTQARDHDNLAVKEVLDTLTGILNRHDNGPDCSLIFYSEMAQEGKPFTYLIVSPQDAATLSKPDAFALLRHKFRLRI